MQKIRSGQNHDQVLHVARKIRWLGLAVACSGLVACTTSLPLVGEEQGEVTNAECGECGEAISRLSALPNVTSVRKIKREEQSSECWISLSFKQPLDHQQADGQGFPQRIRIFHHSFQAPTVFVTLGYQLGDKVEHGDAFRFLSSRQASAQNVVNEIFVEHRLYGNSCPDTDCSEENTPWSALTLRQAAADHSAVLASLQQSYKGVWISYGKSKGGLAALFHRWLYPNDPIAGTIAVGSPFLNGLNDTRFLPFIAQADQKFCENTLQDLQRSTLEIVKNRRDLFLPDGNYSFFKNLNSTYEYLAERLSFDFFERTSSSQIDCKKFKNILNRSEVLKTFFQCSNYWRATNEKIEKDRRFFYQQYTELGTPSYEDESLASLITKQPFFHNPDVILPMPRNRLPPFDGSLVQSTKEWLQEEAKRVVLLYGETDPWTAAAVDHLASDQENRRYVYPTKGHSDLSLQVLPEKWAVDVTQIMQQWMGAKK